MNTSKTPVIDLAQTAVKSGVATTRLRLNPEEVARIRKAEKEGDGLRAY